MPDIRRSLAGVVRAFCHAKILIPVCLMLIYVAAAVALLSAAGLWKSYLLKDTLVWSCVSAVVMMMRALAWDGAEGILRRTLADSIKITVLLEFLVNTYTLSVGVELVLVPVVTLIAMAEAVASLDKEHAAVGRLARAMLVAIGGAVLAIALGRAISDLRGLGSLNTARSVALAPLLSLILFPFVYMMALISKYELVFLSLECGGSKGRRLKRYAKRRIIMHAKLSLGRLQRLQRLRTADLMQVATEADVDRLFQRGRGSAGSTPERRRPVPSTPGHMCGALHHAAELEGRSSVERPPARGNPVSPPDPS